MIKAKKLLLLCLLLFLFSARAYSLEEKAVQKTPTEIYQVNLNTPNQNLKESKEKTNSNSNKLKNLNYNSNQSEKALESPLDLLNTQGNLLTQLENQFKTLTAQVETLEKLSEDSLITITKLRSQLSSCSQQISSLQMNLENYKLALESNKEDTGSLLILLGEATEKAKDLENRINLLEKKEKRAFWFNTIGITTLSLVPFSIGVVEYCKGDPYGKDYMWTGLGLLVGVQLVYQGGHWIFKLW